MPDLVRAENQQDRDAVPKPVQEGRHLRGQWLPAEVGCEVEVVGRADRGGRQQRQQEKDDVLPDAVVEPPPGWRPY